MAEIYKTFMAEAEKLDPEGFAKARAERAELEALRKDAERYRWLRDKAYAAVAVQLMQHMPGEMDGAIDHAMQMDGQDAALRAGRAVGAA